MQEVQPKNVTRKRRQPNASAQYVKRLKCTKSIEIDSEPEGEEEIFINTETRKILKKFKKNNPDTPANVFDNLVIEVLKAQKNN